MDLVGEIDERAGDDEHLQTLRADTAKRLRDEVAAMNLDNFIVRPKRLYVEHYAQEGAWEKLTPTDRVELVSEVAGLPSELKDDDFDAREFDLLVGAVAVVDGLAPACGESAARHAVRREQQRRSAARLGNLVGGARLEVRQVGSDLAVRLAAALRDGTSCF